MKKIIYSLLAISAIGLISFTVANELPIGASLPKADVKMKDITGKEITFSEAQKKNGLLVMFSCNTCPYVIKNQQRTNEIAEYALQNNFGVVIVNSNEGQRNNEDSYEAMRAYAQVNKYKWYYVVDKDSEVADAFGAKRTPEIFLFSSDNKLVYHGAIDDNPSNPNGVNRKHLKLAIDELLSGKDITVKESRSVGCCIKRKS